MKKFLSFAAMLMLLLVLAACNDDEEIAGDNASAGSGDYPEVTFKLAHITPTDHMWHQASEKFKEELESITDGKMSVEIYPASQLGSEADMVQQVEAGSVDISMITAAYLTSRTP